MFCCHVVVAKDGDVSVHFRVNNTDYARFRFLSVEVIVDALRRHRFVEKYTEFQVITPFVDFTENMKVEPY